MLDELIKFVDEAAALPYTQSYKRLVFIFSGHGVNGEKLYNKQRKLRGYASGKLCSQEGHTIEIESIIDHFKPDKHPALGRMARLFFIDACRGDEVDLGVTLQTQGMQEKGGQLLHERGGQFLVQERVSKHANILVAYSTLPNHKTYEEGDGSLWMKFLSEAILNQNEDITTILTDVSNRLNKECKPLPLFLTPQSINQLTERVNFLGEYLSGTIVTTCVIYYSI